MKRPDQTSATCYRDTTLGLALTEALSQLHPAPSSSSSASTLQSEFASSSPSSTTSTNAKRDYILREFDRAFEQAFNHVNHLQTRGLLDISSRVISLPDSRICDESVESAHQDDRSHAIAGAYLRGQLDKYAVCKRTTKVELSNALYTSQRTGAVKVKDLSLSLEAKKSKRKVWKKR